MNSHLSKVRDKIRPLASGKVGDALDLLLELCATQQELISFQQRQIEELEEKISHHSGSSPKPPGSDKP